jgi:hypothetical protein
MQQVAHDVFTREHPQADTSSAELANMLEANQWAARAVRLFSFRAPELTVEQLETAIRGEVRIILNERALDLWLTPEALAAYERAKQDRFLVRRSGEEVLKDAWLFWCKATAEPGVVVTLGAVWARVRLDLLPTGRALSSRAEAAISAMFLRETDHVEYVDGTYVGPDICESRWVPPERARRVAATLYRIAQSDIGGTERSSEITMPGLIRGVARTAAIAGTATAVSNRVSRRQAGRWSDQEQQASQQPPPQQPPPQYQQAPAPPVPVATVAVVQQTAPPPPEEDMSAKLAQLQQLGELKAQGILTDAEFEVQKQRVLSS